MIDQVKSGRHRTAIMAGAAIVAVAMGVVLGAAIQAHRSPSIPANRAEIEGVVHQYILDHPEILPEAMERLRSRQSENAYAQSRAALETPFASAWAGAAKGDVTMVIFSDYACGYCRASVPDIDRLIASDPKLKVVWREIPILGPGSDLAAKASLAAAVQGQFLNFHHRMFAEGRPDEAKVTNVLRSLKIDLNRVPGDVASPVIAAEIKNNLDLASRLDDSIATPTFVVNGQMLKGAVGYDALKSAVADARKRAAAG